MQHKSYNFAMKLLAVLLVLLISTITHVTSLEINSLTDIDIGAEILGVDSEYISDTEFNFVHLALLQYKVVVLRNQTNLTVEGLRSFTQKFGPLHSHIESSSHLNGYTDVNVVSNIRNSTGSIVGLYGKHVESYHSDLSWHQLPTKITVLKSVIKPDTCGDTMFLNTHKAYDELSAVMKDKLDGKQGRYCYLKLRDVSIDGAIEGLTEEEIASASCVIHPIVTVHPITGYKNIYANPSHTSSIIGYSDDESNQLLHDLFEHTAKDKFAYTHKWISDDLLLWDNRAVHHRGTGCPDDEPRYLIRTTVSSDDAPVMDVNIDYPFNIYKDRHV